MSDCVMSEVNKMFELADSVEKYGDNEYYTPREQAQDIRRCAENVKAAAEWERRAQLANRTVSAWVWMLGTKHGHLLAYKDPNSELQFPACIQPPPYYLVSFLDESDFLSGRHIMVWERTKRHLDETGVMVGWNLWHKNNPELRVRPVKVRMSVEFAEKGAKG